MSKIYNEDPNWGEGNTSIKSKRKQSSGHEVVSQEIQRMQHLSFDKISSIQFCIDGAVGLPLSTSATRVTARLMAPDRSQVGDPSAPSFSQSDSDALSPVYDLHMGWRGKTLLPSLTIVCRIDTLERPSLQAKCIGFAALKLCVDERGLQPAADQDQEHVFLNAGQYLLPIVYGSVPVDHIFTEAIMDKLPHIHNAFLRVRLFDPNVENKSGTGNINLSRNHLATPQHGESDAPTYLEESSVACVIISSYQYATPNTPKLPISEIMMDEIQRGMAINGGERRVILRQLGEWVQHVFPTIKQKIPTIDPRFVVNYDDRAGAMVALDMLYNMPNRTDLIAAARSMRKRVLYKSEWNNKINCFKTIFRYLPGMNPNRKGLFQEQNSNSEVIIDDASLELDVTSRELSPVYLDEFSRTAGIELSINACLLIIVTAVDALTDSTATTKKPTQYFKHVEQKKTTSHSTAESGLFPRSHFVDASSVDPNNPMAETTPDEEKALILAKQEKAFKLRGLVGMYYGHEDPNASWWGLLPLMTENPFYKSSVKLHTHTPSSGNENSSVGSGVKSPVKPQTGNNNNKQSNPSPLQQKMAANSPFGGVPNSPNVYFVDAGTHQVPLFEGLPPEELLTATSPMAWLQGMLRAQMLTEQREGSSSFSLCGPSAKQVLEHKRQARSLILSSGCSAFVSVVDPRLKKFSDESVTRDSKVVIKDDSLRKLLKIVTAVKEKRNKAAAQYTDSKIVNVDPKRFNRLFSQFQYKNIPGKKPTGRSFEEALPHNIYHDTFVKELNELFLQTLST